MRLRKCCNLKSRVTGSFFICLTALRAYFDVSGKILPFWAIRFRPSRLSRGRDQEAQVFYDPYHSNFRDHETNGAGESRPRSGIYFLVASATRVTKVKSRLYAPAPSTLPAYPRKA